MKWISGQALRTAERRAVEERGIDGYRLMCRAGAIVARLVSYLARFSETKNIVVVAGHGNNGGDAMIAARCLHEDGFRVTVLMTCLPAVLKGYAKEAWSDLHAAGVSFRVLATLESWTENVWMDIRVFPRNAVIIDGLLGIGLRDKPQDVIEAAIRWINGVRSRCRVCSVDIPSGMNSDTGDCPGEAVQADSTVTFSRPKKGFLSSTAQERLGHLEVVDIGLPDELVEPLESDEAVELIALPEIIRMNSPRPHDAYKGMFGHVLVIGGSKLYPNAPVMTCMGALRSGAGLVTLAGCEESRFALGSWVPEVIFRSSQTETDLFGLAFDSYTSVAVGPGLGVTPVVEKLITHLLQKTRTRLILDADALTVLAGMYHNGWRPEPSGSPRIVITPHPGEAARLLGCGSTDIQKDRIGSVRLLADRYQCVAVLKGAGSLICEPGGKPWLAIAGNPGMATAGSGDVLTGVIAGLAAKNFGCLNAAQIGVWIHGVTGDFVAIERGQETMTAMMIAERLKL